MRISTKLTLAISALALSVSLGAPNAGAQDMKKVVIGTEGAYPPFNNLEADGTLTGFDIDACCVGFGADGSIGLESAALERPPHGVDARVH